MISCHCFLLITSTRPPRAVTRLYNSYRSRTCLAMIGRRLMGVPETNNKKLKKCEPKNKVYLWLSTKVTKMNSSYRSRSLNGKTTDKCDCNCKRWTHVMVKELGSNCKYLSPLFQKVTIWFEKTFSGIDITMLKTYIMLKKKNQYYIHYTYFSSSVCFSSIYAHTLTLNIVMVRLIHKP